MLVVLLGLSTLSLLEADEAFEETDIVSLLVDSLCSVLEFPFLPFSAAFSLSLPFGTPTQKGP